MNMRRPMTVVNFDKITKIIQRLMPFSEFQKEMLEVVDTTVFRIKQSVKYLATCKSKDSTKKTRKIIPAKRNKYGCETENNRKHRL